MPWTWQKEAKITIESTTKLSKEEIEKLKEDAEKFSDEDKKKKEKIDLKNEAESYIYTTEKLVNHDLKDKISQEQGIKITDAVKEVREVLDKESNELVIRAEPLNKDQAPDSLVPAELPAKTVFCVHIV